MPLFVGSQTEFEIILAVTTTQKMSFEPQIFTKCRRVFCKTLLPDNYGHKACLACRLKDRDRKSAKSGKIAKENMPPECSMASPHPPGQSSALRAPFGLARVNVEQGDSASLNIPGDVPDVKKRRKVSFMLS